MSKKCSGGAIYILTNPSFPKYVKIGYSDDVYKRLEELNRSECIPFAFRLYAYYKVGSRFSDKKIHEIIDGLNSNLRSIDKLNGKERKREFYAMPKEQVFGILKSMAEIHGTEKNLVLVEPTKEELKEEEKASEIENIPLDLEHFYLNKNKKLINLHEELLSKFKGIHNEVYEVVTPNYIAIRNKKGKNICEVHIYKFKILIVTRVPSKEALLIGERVSDKYLWSLNYRIYFDDKKDINKVVEVLCDVYDQIK